MKTLKLFSIAAALLAMQSVVAQNPAISTNYSDSEIAATVERFRAANAHDVFPSDMLWQKFRSDFPRANDVEWEMANDTY
ncbi:MAG: hypothetical protein LBD45_06445, partial [Bacteroidales bacterium]|nr:hypothetical protein [Bacteroidales bacterium]